MRRFVLSCAGILPELFPARKFWGTAIGLEDAPGEEVRHTGVWPGVTAGDELWGTRIGWTVPYEK